MIIKLIFYVFVYIPFWFLIFNLDSDVKKSNALAAQTARPRPHFLPLHQRQKAVKLSQTRAKTQHLRRVGEVTHPVHSQPHEGGQDHQGKPQLFQGLALPEILHL